MRNVVYAALLVATPAAAQPVTQPKACQVTIARAPDDVRAVVETWVKSEVQCSVSLELRIVPTEGGLYLLAQDEQGRVRERIVPDAQTAGVLVASWIADDNAPPPPAPPPPIAAAPVPLASVPSTTESLTPPGLAPVSLTASSPISTTHASKWLTVGALMPVSEHSGSGLRIEADILRRGRWFFGGALSGANGYAPLVSSYGYGSISTEDYKFITYVSRPSQFGRWQLRPSLGVGLVHTEGVAYDGNSMFYPIVGTFPTAEASLLLSRDVGKSWALYGGPLATAYAQTYESYASSSVGSMQITRGDIDLALFAGLRHRL
jgi:hypothetical protein